MSILLSYPTTTYVVSGVQGPIEFTLAMGVLPFTVLVFVLGFFMSLGKAAVYKHIPVYYPNNVGAVGGMVGMIGGLGGFLAGWLARPAIASLPAGAAPARRPGFRSVTRPDGQVGSSRSAASGAGQARAAGPA